MMIDFIYKLRPDFRPDSIEKLVLLIGSNILAHPLTTSFVGPAILSSARHAALSQYMRAARKSILQSSPMTDGFRWRARAWHLTYSGHVPPELILAVLFAASRVRVICTSIVHEKSDAEVPYDHTHVAWMWEREVNLHGSHIMDVSYGGRLEHPHAEHRKSLKWLQGLFERYHQGYKADASGRVRCVPPVAGPWQTLPTDFVWNDFIITEVSEAPDLIEGAKIANVSIRSMHDVLLVQNAKRPASFDHNFERSSFLPLELPCAFSTRAMGTLHVYGARNLGKSEWALSQFCNPLLVTERNQLLAERGGPPLSLGLGVYIMVHGMHGNHGAWHAWRIYNRERNPKVLPPSVRPSWVRSLV